MESHSESLPVDRQRLVDLVVFEYRSLVVRRLAVTAEWRVLEWTDAAACARKATRQLMCALPGGRRVSRGRDRERRPSRMARRAQ